MLGFHLKEETQWTLPACTCGAYQTGKNSSPSLSDQFWNIYSSTERLNLSQLDLTSVHSYTWHQSTHTPDAIMTSFITSVSPKRRANTAVSTCHCQVEGHRSSTAEHPLLKLFHTTTLWKHDKARAALPPFSKWQCSLTLLKPNQIRPELVLGSPTPQQVVPISAVLCHIPEKMFCATLSQAGELIQL